MKIKNSFCGGSEGKYGPRQAGEILREMMEHGDDAFAAGYHNYCAGMNRNTVLCVDLKTFLRSDRMTLPGHRYLGVLTCDEEDHFTFIETAPPYFRRKRNPHLFVGQYITITQKDDGTLRPNFRPLKMGNGLSALDYAIGVGYELFQALNGLVGKV